MRTKNQKTKIHRLPMSSKEMCFALFAFRKAYAHEHFVYDSIRIRLSNALQDMGLDGGSQEEATKQYESLFSNTMLNQTK